jgi:cell division septal protein FtsQ
MRNKRNRYKKREVLGTQGKNYAKKRNNNGLIIRIFKKIFFVSFIFFIYWFFSSGALAAENYDYQVIDIEVKLLVEKELDVLKQTFVSRNFYIFSKDSIEKHLEESLPQLKDIKVEKEWKSKSITIFATLKKPVFALSCKEEYVLDSEGIILGLRQDEELPIISVSDYQEYLSVGDKPFDRKVIVFLNEVRNNQYLIGSDIKTITFLNNQKKDLEIMTEKGYKIFFDCDRSAKNQLEILSRILNEISQSGKDQVEYIDLRIEDKIYYR